MRGVQGRGVLRIGVTAIVAVLMAGCGGPHQAGGVLVIESVPVSGARVLVNGRPFGNTPLTVRGLPEGPVHVRLSAPGYRLTSQTAHVPATGEERLVITLELLAGYVTFESEPIGAEILLNGIERLGTTPLVSAPVPVGEYTYVLRLEHYEDFLGAMTVDQDYRYRLLHQLKPKPAQLEVYSTPTNATIVINDNVQPDMTPARFTLIPGAYTVAVYARGFVTHEELVRLEPDGHTQLEIRLREGNAPFGMVLVPAGEFVFGVDDSSPDERPRKTVYLDAFYIDKYEVTNLQYRAVFPSHVFEVGREQFPVTGVSYEQAVKYAAAVGKRLPTEQEWEKAARGTDGRTFPWGNQFKERCCNYNTGPGSTVMRVSQFREGISPHGCMDMAGNVYEWTSSWYQAYPDNKDVRVEYGQIFRVLRGGSYRSAPFDVRAPRRHYDRMDAARADYGLRCVMEVPEKVEGGP